MENTSASMTHLFDVLLSDKAESEKRDAYMKLNSMCNKDVDSSVKCFLERKVDLVKVLKAGIQSKNKDKREVALLFLNGCLSQTKIVEIMESNQIEEILLALLDVMECINEKSTFIRGFWCLSHQKIDCDLMNKYVSRIVKIMKSVSQHSDCQFSETVLRECFNALKRLVVQCASAMEDVVIEWMTFLLHYICCRLEKTCEAALDLLDASMELLLRKQNVVAELFHHTFKEKKLPEQLKTFFENKKYQVFVLNTWACSSRILGKKLFSFPVTEVLNPLLQIANKAYTSKDNEVALAANNLWRALTDVFFLGDERCHAEIIRMFGGAISIRRTNPKLAIEILRTQWHLLCKIGDNINNYVDNIVFPIIEIHLGTNLLITKNKITETKEVAKKRKSIAVNDVEILTLMAVDILNQLMNGINEHQNNRFFEIEQFNGAAINNEHIKKHFQKIITFLTNAALHLLLKWESTVSQVWLTFMIRIRQIAGEDEQLGKCVWPLILDSLRKVMNEKDYLVLFILKNLLCIPEDSLSCFVMLPWKQDEQQKERLYLSMFEFIFDETFIKKQALEQEKYFILYERLLVAAYSGEFEQLSHAEFIIDHLASLSSLLNDQDMRWRLWSSHTYQLEKFITKTNTVSEDSKSTGNKFAAILKTLTYPLRDMEMKLLMDGTVKELLTTWKDLFISFSRAVNLISGLETNVASEEFMKILNELILTNKEKLHDERFVKPLLQMVDTCYTSMVFIGQKQLPLFNQRLTPTKFGKKMSSHDVLDGVKHFVDFLNITFDALWENLSTKRLAMSQSVVDLIDITEKYVNKLQDYHVVIESFKQLNPVVIRILTNPKKYPKILLRTEKLILLIFRKLEANKSQLNYNECADVLEGVLMACVQSERKELIKKTVSFWNHNFGMNKQIKISDELRNVFTSCKSKVKFSIPGSISDVQDAFPHDDAAVFENIAMSAVKKSPNPRSSLFQSPVKQHGSFLMFGLKHSPGKNNSPEPTKNSPFSAKKKIRKHLSTETFVEIKEYPKRKKLLTEHQKDKMMERKSIPAMYNSLDQSQDTSIFRKLVQDSNSQSLFSGQSNIGDENTTQHEDVKIKPEEGTIVKGATVESNEQGETKTSELDSSLEIINTPSTKSFEIEGTGDMNNKDQPDNYSHDQDIIPSSQTQPEYTEDMLSICDKTSILKGVEKTSASEHCTEFIKENTPPLVFKEKQHFLTPKSIERTKMKKRIASDKRFQQEAKIIVAKLPTSCKRKRRSILQTGSEQKRRKSEGDMMKFLKKKTTEGDTDDVKKNSPVAGRTRRKKQPKHSELIKSTSGKSETKVEETVNESEEKNCSQARDSENTMTSSQQEKSATENPKTDIGEFQENKSVENMDTDKKIEKTDFKKTEKSDKETSKVSTETVSNRSVTSKDQGLLSVTKKQVDVNNLTPAQQIKENRSTLQHPVDANKKPDSKVTQDMQQQVDAKKTPTQQIDVKLITTSQQHDVDVDTEPMEIEKIVETESSLSKSNDESEKEVTKKTVSSHINNVVISKETPVIAKESPVIAKEDHVSSKENPVEKSSVENATSAILLSRTSLLSSSSLSPSCRNTLKTTSSPAISPISGILKKRCKDSPPISPSVKSRRVSFQLPGGTVVTKEEIDMWKFSADDDVPLTKPSPSLRRKKKMSTLIEKTEKEVEVERIPVFPDLIKCTTSIEKILPSLTFARGITHVVRAKNIYTIGDLSSLSENQIESLPIRSPKVPTVRSALRAYSTQNRFKSVTPKSPLFAERPNEKSLFGDSDGSLKQSKEELFDEAALLATPSRKEVTSDTIHVKPTSLFHDTDCEKSVEMPKCQLKKESLKESANDSFDDIVAINDSLTEDGVNNTASNLSTSATVGLDKVAFSNEISENKNEDIKTKEENIFFPSENSPTATTPEAISKKQLDSPICIGEQKIIIHEVSSNHSDNINDKSSHPITDINVSNSNNISISNQNHIDSQSNNKKDEINTESDNIYLIPETESFQDFSVDQPTNVFTKVNNRDVKPSSSDSEQTKLQLMSNIEQENVNDDFNRDIFQNKIDESPLKKDCIVTAGTEKLDGNIQNPVENIVECNKQAHLTGSKDSDEPRMEVSFNDEQDVNRVIQSDVMIGNELNKVTSCEKVDLVDNMKKHISSICLQELSSAQLFELLSHYKNATSELYVELEKRFNK